jgi:hypothetical protein
MPGILSGLTIGTERSNIDDPHPDFGALWAQAISDALRRRQRTDSSTPTDPTSEPMRPFDDLDLGGQRGAAGSDRGSAQPSRTVFWPQFGLPIGAAPTQNTSSSARSDRASTLPQSAVRATAPTFDRSRFPAGFVPVGYDDTVSTRPWWAPPSVLEEWEKHFKAGNKGLYDFLFQSRSFGSGGRGQDEEACDRRRSEEVQRCYQRKWQMPHPDYLGGCLKRAEQRYLKCM